MHDSWMSPPRARSSRPLFLGALCLALASGCASGGSKADPFGEPTEAPTTQSPFGSGASEAIEEAANDEAESAARADEERRDAAAPSERKSSEMIVIDPGEATDRAPTLAEASARAKQRRREGSEETPVAVITNDNLSDYASRGNLTFAEPKEGQEDDGGGGETASSDQDEAYWRGEARRIRETWREAVDEITSLEDRVAGLRTRFYAEDDPYIRDNRIKPAWDRALDRLSQARTRAEASQEELEDFLDRGRREGAQPGWLREGVELEPEVAAEEDSRDGTVRDGLGALEPIEPITSEEDAPP